jgi:hypothetical protein
MGGEWSTPERDEKVHTVLLLENLKGRDHSEDLGVDGNFLKNLTPVN